MPGASVRRVTLAGGDMKLAQPLVCVPAGEIYPRVIEAGEECPPEFEAMAKDAGLLEAEPELPAKKPKPEKA